ncbi:DUF5388 domain-containing protein [Kurthia massiliensis]|uniref:DUF5388 domain-containing protein n=1 Tax=Kurthia massiliensis TaxID=1033739 RepID=UPI00028A2F25|nr:DUF5388 domain-containing protein [Kurthia massiliensis]
MAKKSLLRHDRALPDHLKYNKEEVTEEIKSVKPIQQKAAMLRVDEQTKNKISNLVKVCDFKSANELINDMVDVYMKSLDDEKRADVELMNRILNK